VSDAVDVHAPTADVDSPIARATGLLIVGS